MKNFHFFLIIITIDMNYTHFISNQGWIEFNYPSNMISVEEDEGTYLFYTPQTGSFRLTPLILVGNGAFNADKYLIDASNDYDGDILQNHHGKNYVYSVSRSIDDNEDLTIFSWIFAGSDKIIYCSYTIDTDTLNIQEIILEKDEIFKIIENLNFS